MLLIISLAVFPSIDAAKPIKGDDLSIPKLTIKKTLEQKPAREYFETAFVYIKNPTNKILFYSYKVWVDYYLVNEVEYAAVFPHQTKKVYGTTIYSDPAYLDLGVHKIKAEVYLLDENRNIIPDTNQNNNVKEVYFKIILAR